MLWPRDQDTEFPVEACWRSQTQEGQTKQIHPQIFDDPFFYLHWHDLHALGSHWTDSQQGILCWGFKQEEIPSKEASTLQISTVAFPPGQCTSQQLHPCHRQDGHQDSSSPSLRDNWGNERGCDEGHWHAHTRGLPWGIPEVVGMVQKVHCSRRRLLRRGLKFHVCTININAYTKKSLETYLMILVYIYYDPRIYIFIYIYIYIYIYISY